MQLSKWIGISLVVGAILAVGGQQANAQLRSTPLTDAEKASIALVRIDEKLARDVYLTLFEVWGDPVFANIAASEQKHMDAVKRLIDKYKLADPVAGLGIGEFPTPALQELYEEFMAEGQVSLVAAYGVGVLIEQLDIDDLTETLKVVQKIDIQNVFTNLLAGSLKHLEAFETH
jgi:hypothetical protein